jgi:hypothetical protein
MQTRRDASPSSPASAFLPRPWSWNYLGSWSPPPTYREACIHFMSRTATICLCSIDERRAAVKGPSQAQLQNRLETSPKCRLGSEADIAVGQRDVLYSPQSRHSSARLARPLCAESGHQLAAQQLRFVQSVMVRVRRSGPQLRSVLCRPVFCVVTSLDRCVAVTKASASRRGGFIITESRILPYEDDKEVFCATNINSRPQNYEPRENSS